MTLPLQPSWTGTRTPAWLCSWPRTASVRDGEARGCGSRGGGRTRPGVAARRTAPAAPRRRWTPPPQKLTWYWQLQGRQQQPGQASDIDGFDNTAATVAALHARGKHAICYIDFGTSENLRSDSRQFPARCSGSRNGWPGEHWLDIRQLRCSSRS